MGHLDFEQRKMTKLLRVATNRYSDAETITLSGVFDFMENPSIDFLESTHKAIDAFEKGGFVKSDNLYTKLKKEALQCVCFAGVFPKRISNDVEVIDVSAIIPDVAASGIVVLEVDLDSEKPRGEELTKVENWICRLKDEDYVYALTATPSGGFRVWIVFETPPKTMDEYDTQWLYGFNILRAAGIVADSSGSNFGRKMNIMANGVIYQSKNYKPIHNPSQSWIDMHIPKEDCAPKHINRPSGGAIPMSATAQHLLLQNLIDSYKKSTIFNPKQNDSYFLYNGNRHIPLISIAGRANRYGIKMNDLVSAIFASQGVDIASRYGATYARIKKEVEAVYSKYQDQWATWDVLVQKPKAENGINFGSEYIEAGLYGRLSDAHDKIHDFISKNKQCYIVAPTGVGKSTYWLLNYWRYGCDIVLHVPTTALGCNLLQNAKKYGVKACLIVADSDDVSDLDELDTLLMCENSECAHCIYIVVQGNLHRIEKPESKILVIDEAHELISGFYKSAGMSNLYMQSVAFKRTVFMSGTYIRSVSLMDVPVMRIHQERDARKIIRIESDSPNSLMLKMVMDSKNSHRKAFVMSMDKAKLESWAVNMSNKGMKALFISADNKRGMDQNIFIKNGSFLYDVVFTTPLLNVGWSSADSCDIDMFIVGESTSIEMEQFYSRIRNPKNVRYFHITGESKPKTTFRRIDSCLSILNDAKKYHSLMQSVYNVLEERNMHSVLSPAEEKRIEFAKALMFEMDLQKLILTNPAKLCVELVDGGYSINTLMIDQIQYLVYTYTEMGNFDLLKMNLESWGNEYILESKGVVDDKQRVYELSLVKQNKERLKQEAYANMTQSNIRMLSLDRSDRIKQEAGKRVSLLQDVFNMSLSDAKRVAMNAGGDVDWRKTLKVLKWNYLMAFKYPKMDKGLMDTSPTMKFMKELHSAFLIGKPYTHAERVSIVECLLINFFQKERLTNKIIEFSLLLVGDWNMRRFQDNGARTKMYSLCGGNSIHTFTNEGITDSKPDHIDNRIYSLDELFSD